MVTILCSRQSQQRLVVEVAQEAERPQQKPALTEALAVEADLLVAQLVMEIRQILLRPKEITEALERKVAEVEVALLR